MKHSSYEMKSGLPITQHRMTIQFAADAEGLWHDPASAGIRKEFHLPPGGLITR